MTIPSLLAINDREAALAAFSQDALWALFDGDRAHMNLAHECLDRHRGRGTAVSVKFDDGRLEHYSFDELSAHSARFAHWLARQGIRAGDRVALRLEPGRAFYTCLFGAIKHGAIAVPLFTLFGPDGLALRLDDCTPRLIVTSTADPALSARFPGLRVVVTDDDFWSALMAESSDWECRSGARDLAVFQYTSGTTRALPEAVKHTHRSVVTLMVATLYGVGLRPGDRYFCPSSPAWGHGLWHGTFSPLALGIPTATYSGQFNPQRIFEALVALDIDNLAAAATVYRMLRNAGLSERYPVRLRKCTFTGEPLDDDTFDWVTNTFGCAPGSMYGTTEVGVIIVDYPGMTGHPIRRGALGRAAPGNTVAVIDEHDQPVAPGVLGEIAVKRQDQWFRVKDLGRIDDAGYFHHAGRADDVIISAGWTMSAVEIENSLLSHPAVAEAAVIGVPDPVRGQVAKAYLVLREGQTVSAAAIQDHLKARLSRHEYPRAVAFVTALPKTPAGKINRKALRDDALALQHQEAP